jgi:cyclophilin family peptidyl-prolyl cis-trans isomerase/HEAT repeat protein
VDTRAKSLLGPSSLAFIALACAALVACSKDDGQEAWRNIRRWEDTRSLAPDSLASYLEDGEAPLRAAAARAAGRIGDTRALWSLSSALRRDARAEVRAEAAFALGIMGDKSAGPDLMRALATEKDAHALGEIALALGRLDLKESTPQLLPLLREGHPHVQEQCLESLALLADSTSVEALLAASQSGLESVRWRAAYALEKISAAAPSARPRLLELIDDESSLVQRYAIRSLGRLGVEGTAMAIAQAMAADRGDWQLQVTGCDALGRLKDEAAVPALRAALAHESFHVKRAALMAMARRKERELLPEILDLCSHNSVNVREAAYDAVASCLEGRAEATLLVGLDDPSDLVAATCARRLGECSAERASVALIELFQSSEKSALRAAAISGLGEAGDRAPRELIARALADEDWVVATAAAEALAKLGAREHLEDLLRAYEERSGAGRQDVCWQILQSLETLKADDSDAIALARRALEREDDFRLRSAALAYLRSSLNDAEVAALPTEESLRHDIRPVRRDPHQPARVVHSGAQQLVIESERGTIVIELLGSEAPQTVESFAALAENGFFDDLGFHRVVPNFVIQGGDPLGTGWGDPGYTLRSEWNPLRYERGVVGIAHSGKDTGGCQFFITHSPQPHLNARYTIFGRVITGMDVVDRIQMGDRFSATVRRSAES